MVMGVTPAWVVQLDFTRASIDHFESHVKRFSLVSPRMKNVETTLKGGTGANTPGEHALTRDVDTRNHCQPYDGQDQHCKDGYQTPLDHFVLNDLT
jgi:hypothetical protein